MINETLRNIREKKGLRQDDIAEALGVAQQTVLKWENGKTEPKASQIVKLSNVLGVPIDALFGNETITVDQEMEYKIRETAKLNEEEKKCLNMFIEAMLIRHYSNTIRITNE